MENTEEIIDKLKIKFNLKSDTAVAELLGVAKQNISAFRSGQRDVPRRCIVKAWDLLDYTPKRDDVIWLVGGEAAEIIREIDKRLASNFTKIAS